MKDLKELLKPNYNADIASMKIIFQGKILKDTDVLQDVNVKNDSTMHLVIAKSMKPFYLDNPVGSGPQPNQ